MTDESPFREDSLFALEEPVAAVATLAPPKANGASQETTPRKRAPETHRLLPQSSEAEQGVLSSFLLAPVEIGVMCSEQGITPEHFHLPAHATIYEVLLEMWSTRKPIDFISLTQVLRDQVKLDEVGGAGFVTQLFTFLPTAANAGYYIDILKEKLTLREVIKTCTEYAAKGYDEQDDLPGLLVGLHAAVTRLVLVEKREHKTMRELALETSARIIERGTGNAPQIRTGIEKMDAESPVRPGDYLVIAGRRKSGKSALVSEILKRVSVVAKQPAAVFSLEMPDWQWTERLIANLGTISLRSISIGKLNEGENDRFTPTISEIASAPIELFDSIYDLPAIVAKLRQLKAKIPSLMLAAVDYGQLVRVAMRRGANREQEVAEVSRTLRLLAGELQISVIILSQLNEDGSTRESKSLENDCTALWKVVEDLDDKGNPKVGAQDNRTLVVPFQRNGPPNVRVRMKFHGMFARFTPEEDEPALAL